MCVNKFSLSLSHKKATENVLWEGLLFHGILFVSLNDTTRFTHLYIGTLTGKILLFVQKKRKNTNTKTEQTLTRLLRNWKI